MTDKKAGEQEPRQMTPNEALVELVQLNRQTHKVLLDIQNELRLQGKVQSRMNTAIQIIGLIIVLAAAGSCLLGLFGASLF